LFFQYDRFIAGFGYAYYPEKYLLGEEEGAGEGESNIRKGSTVINVDINEREP
jgi:hypothetical protein